MNRQILVGDVLEKLDEIPEKSIDCVISSPPYWGLRDYGIEGQWGLEPDFHEYLSKMNQFMDLIKRVLKDTGTVWINLGDTYTGGNAHSDWGGVEDRFVGKNMREGKFEKTEIKKNHLKTKSRYGIPERFYINCIDNGWIARNHIPWYKANSMPSSVKDRFTNKWESIFFFAKQQKYYFNLDAVREKAQTETKPFNVRVRDTDKDRFLQKALDSEVQNHNEKGERKQDNTLGADGKPKANYKGFNDRWEGQTNGKNPGDVFFINPRPFPEAHFATFPMDLPLKILKCACPNQVCKKCGKNRETITETNYQKHRPSGGEKTRNETNEKRSKTGNWGTMSNNLIAQHEVIGYTDCGCNAGWEAGIVLDPFFGAGTVGLAAEKLGLNWMGIELNDKYVEIARKRLNHFKNKRLES